MELVLIHGWGFDAHFWDALAPMLPFKQQPMDLGFFNKKTSFSIPSDAILVGHSLGFIHGWNQKQDWKAWIAINSFSRFIKTQTHIGCVPESELRNLYLRLAAHPQKALEATYQFMHAKTTPGSPNIENLRKGLDELRDSDLSEILPSFDVPGLILASRNDQLVPIETSRVLGNKARHIAWHETGGHMLPQNDPAWCAGQIKNFLEKLSF